MSRSRTLRFTGAARVARGLVLSCAVLAITCLGHSVGTDGQLPEPAAYLLLTPLALALGAALAERRMSVLGLTGFVLGTQALLHVALVMGFGGPGHHPGGAGLVPGSRMLIAHAIASLVVIAVLAYGEDVLHCWIRFLTMRSRAWRIALPELPWGDGGAVPVAAGTWPTQQFFAKVRTRGPPVVS